MDSDDDSRYGYIDGYDYDDGGDAYVHGELSDDDDDEAYDHGELSDDDDDDDDDCDIEFHGASMVIYDDDGDHGELSDDDDEKANDHGELSDDDDDDDDGCDIEFHGALMVIYDDDGEAYDHGESSDDDDDNNYCDIEFDGASMANPGKCGAGAIVRVRDGRTWHLREGLGITTSSVAKYRGLMLGMRFALQEGFQKIYATGDSILICNQVEGKWEIRNPKLIALNEEVQGLKDHFYEFTISHVRKELNAEAAFQADQASYLPNGQMEKEYCESLADDDDCYGNGNDDDENGSAGTNEDNADDVLNVNNQTHYNYLEDNYSDKCDIEYDGASKGNPGKGGAGAIIRAHDGRIWRLREGLGITTSNVAEYRGLILGMRFALEKGYQKIYVTGDSLLICNQVKGKWEIRNPNLIALNKEVQDLKNQLYEFTISHVGREFNVEADFQADQASCLPDGETEVDDE